MKSIIKPVMLFALFIGASAFTNQSEKDFSFRKQKNPAFTYGEKLEFRVHYGIINAASVSMQVDDTPEVVNGRPTYHIIAKGKTFSSFDWMYKVRDHFESNVDSVSIAPLKYFKSVQEDNYKDIDLVYYDHEKKWMRGKKKNMDMPEYVQDIVSGTFYARTIDFSDAYAGKSYPLNIYLDQKIYNLQFKYLGKETIKSDVGKVRCIKLRPQLVVDRVFKDEDDMTIWITDDANHVPVRIQTDIFVGSLKVDLTSYKGLRNPFTSLEKK